MKVRLKQLVLSFVTGFFVLPSAAQIPQLWGLADGPGTNPSSVIFKVNSDGSGYGPAYTTSGMAGGAPSGSLIETGDGLLYGMCENGGANGFGVIFSFDPETSTFTKLFDFNGTTGANPFGSLVQVTCEDLYGMTQTGGAYGKGVVFSISTTTHVYTKHFDFIYPKGMFPAGNLMKASNGLLYGLTNGGGTSNGGTLFSFDPSNNTFAKLYDFSGANGQSPFGSLMQADDGKLYGMTYYGGNYNLGTIFRFDLSNNTCTKLLDCSNSKGIYPLGNLMQAANGLLYGLTPSGGSNSSGVLFSINPTGGVYTKILDLGFSGAQPNGTLLTASDGYLYGTAEAGGSGLKGTVFRFNPTTGNLVTIYNFSSNSGAKSPSCDLVEYIPVHIDVTGPNIFTPNDDGINDTWFPIISEFDYSITEFHLNIYDRWGAQVFESGNEKKEWDGKAKNGHMCADGTYYYVLNWKATSTSCKEKKGKVKGYIELVK